MGLLTQLVRDAGPIAWLLDDVQWIDPTSLQLLERLDAALAGLPLLLLATARPEGRVDEVARALGSGVTLTVAPLDDAGLAALVAGELGIAPGDIEPEVLAPLARRTAGSPLAAHEALRAVLEAGVLRLSWGRWRFDAEALRHLDLPDDLLELIVRRIARLPPDAHDLLFTAAVVGSRLSLPLLADVRGVTVRRCAEDLAPALEANLVEPADDGAYAFVHDRIREAALADADDASLRARHRAVSDALEARGEAGPGATYALAHHAWEGGLDDRPARTHALAVLAARTAVDEAAFELAHTWYGRAARAAEVAGVDPAPPFAEAFGEVCVRVARVDEATAWLQRALATEAAPVPRARIRLALGRIELGRHDNAAAQAELDRGLGELGTGVPGRGPVALARTLWAVVVGWVMGSFPRWIRTASGAERDRLVVLQELLRQAGVAAYFEMDRLTMVQTLLRMRPIVLRLGPGAEVARLKGQAGVVYSILGRRATAARLRAEAAAMASQARDRVAEGQVGQAQALGEHFLGEVLAAADTARRTLATFERWMENADYLTLSADLTWNLLMRGHVREAADRVEHALARAGRSSAALAEGHTHRCYAGPVLAHLGRGTEGRAHLDAFAELVRRSPDRWRTAQHLAMRTLQLAIEGDVGPAFEETLARFVAATPPARRLPLQLRQGWIAAGYARLLQRERGEPGAAERLTDALGQLARLGPHPTVLAHRRVIEAGDHALSGRREQAEAALDEAARLARDTDNPWVLLEVAWRRAQLLERAGCAAAAARERATAAHLAAVHGLAARLRQMRIAAPASTSDAAPGDVRVREHLEALLEVGRASASILEPAQKARVALDQVLRLVGAERALLFLGDGESLALSAGRDAQQRDIDTAVGSSTTVVERVRVTLEPVVLAGAVDGEALGADSVVANDLRSVAAAPLVVGERLVGVLYVDTRLGGARFDGVGALLTAVAGSLAMALETARAARLEVAVTAERDSRRLAERMRAVSAALSASLDVTGLAAHLADGLGALLPVDRHALLLREDGGWRLGAGAPPEGFVPDDVATLLSGRRCGAVTLRGVSWLCAPLHSRDEAVGLLLLGRAEGDYTAADAALLDAFAGQIATAVDNARLFGEVQQANAQLEARVEERTLALSASLATLEEEVEERIVAQHRAQAANRAKSAFLANTSHELRTPLNAVVGYAELVREELVAEGREALVADLDRVLSAARHLLRLIDDVLDLSRIEADRLDVQVRDVALDAVVAGVFQTIAPLASQRGDRLRSELDPAAAAVRADPQRLRQVLVNWWPTP
ncbi:MAG: histidine kinase dimerization/phospho-acceptor domain-containing protein [Myxococcota bacterium]